MLEELLAAFGEVARRTDDRVVVLTGAGGDFSSGADLTALRGEGDHQLVRMRLLGDVVVALHRIPKPTIAKVRGVAVGAGCNLAIGCDLVVAAETARMSQLFSKRGLSVDGGGSWLLPRRVGLHRAKELAFFADILSAEQAESYGLVNLVVSEDEIDAVVEEWARRLCAGPPLALSMTKTMLDNSTSVSLEQAVEDEARCQAMNASTEDTREALRAFVDKRDPVYKGR